MKKFYLFFFIVITSFNQTGCSSINIKNPHTNIEIVSLKEYYDRFYQIALSWDDMAYLDRVDIPIHIDNSNLIQISASFQSPNKKNQCILIELLSDGTIYVDYIEHNLDIIQTVPIKVTDWDIDSTKVLLIIQKMVMD